MGRTSIIVGLLWSQGVWAQPADAPEPEPEVPTTEIAGPIIEVTATVVEVRPQARLEKALALYQTGQHELARAAFTELVLDTTVQDLTLRQEARVYLGEILFVQGEVEAARRTFEAVLLEQPDFTIDRFRHPPDVCGYFEEVRAATTSIHEVTAQVIPPPPAPLPVMGYMGFGLYQLDSGNTRQGVTLLVSQATLGVTSAVLFGVLLADRTYNPDFPSELAQLKALRAGQWIAQTGFLGIHLTSTLKARKHWISTSQGR